MRRNLHLILAAALIAFAFTAFAEISQTFEPLPGYTMSVRNELKAQNWHFPDFDINPTGVEPIAGVNSIAAGAAISPTQQSGVITPFFTFGNSETIRFKYKLSRGIPSTSRRWFLVYLGDSSGMHTLVDSVEITTGMGTIDYSLNINGHAGTHVVYVNIRGIGSTSKFVMDNFYFSGALANDPSGFVSGPSEKVKNSISKFNSINDDLEVYEGGKDEIVSLFPNSSKNILNLEIYSDNTEKGRFEVYSEDGTRQICMPGMNLVSGMNTMNFDMSVLAPGKYYVNVVTGSEVITKRFERIQ